MKEQKNPNLIDEVLTKYDFSKEEQTVFWECLKIIQEQNMEKVFDIENQVYSKIKEVAK